jgi:BirA family biotin operon repressor/biotin-[acetyl-CoA-carboxylase] ligase
LQWKNKLVFQDLTNDYSEIDLDLSTGIGKKVLYFQSIDSTNNYLRRHIESFPEGTVILAGSQASGRGRGQNKWESPPNKGLYFSILIKPCITQDDIQLLSLMISLAIKKGVEDVTENHLQQPEILDIKWPNDLFHKGKKWCGILIEGITHNDTISLIVGIGLNVETIDNEFNPTIRKEITCLNDIYNFKFNHRETLRAILTRIEEYYRNFNPEMIVEEYKSVCSIWGHRCIININGHEWKGICKSIKDKGELVVEVDGTDKIFINGTLQVEW